MPIRDGGYIALSNTIPTAAADDNDNDTHDHTQDSSQPLLSSTARTAANSHQPHEGFTRPIASGGSFTLRPSRLPTRLPSSAHSTQRANRDDDGDGGRGGGHVDSGMKRRYEYTYAYGPKGLPGLIQNRFALLCATFASIGGLTFGYDQGVIANVLVMKDFLERWPITPLQKGVMTAVLELGALVGALGAGVLADRFSRRHSILFACVVFCIGSILQCTAQSITHLSIGRAVGGLGVGALSMLSPLYMAEISPPELRGSLMALEQFSIVLGVVFGFWTGFMTRDIVGPLSWRIPLSVQVIPGLILGGGCLLLPPSPRLLVLQGRKEEALKSLQRLRLRSDADGEDDSGGGGGADLLIQIELLEMQVEAELVRRTFTNLRTTASDADGDGDDRDSTAVVKQQDLQQHGLVDELKAWKKLFGKKYRDRTMVGVLIMAFQQWSGINALLYYGPTLVRSIGFEGDDTVTLLVSGGIGIVQFVAVIPAILFIDRWGRKPLLRGGSAVMATSHLCIALLVLQFGGQWPTHPAAAWAAVVGIYTFTAAYGTSFGPIGWVLPSEVFPLAMRSKGVALSTASNWVNNFIIGLVTPILMEFSAAATFATFSTACFVGYLWSTYVVPETANVSLEEMDGVFQSSAGQEEMLIKEQIEDMLGLHELIREM